MLLSGFMFPISSMPRVLQIATHIIPMRYYLIIVLDIMLKGSGAAMLWDQTIRLIGLALGFLTFATCRFQKKLDLPLFPLFPGTSSVL